MQLLAVAGLSTVPQRVAINEETEISLTKSAASELRKLLGH